MSVLRDTSSGKNFYYSLIWKELSENVSIAWCLEKYVVLFEITSIRMPVMFDMNFENLFTLVCYKLSESVNIA